MPETVTARDANHHFARLLREVEGGKEILVTRNGVPVARILPATESGSRRRLTAAQEAALARTMERARAFNWGSVEHIDRSRLYAEVEDTRTRVPPKP